MKNNLKIFTAGFLTCAFLTVSALTLHAQTVQRNITYGVRVSLNGEMMQLSEAERPFIMEGRTFLPVRAISEAVGLPVDFDSATSTVFLGNRHAGQRQPLQHVAPYFNYGGNVSSPTSNITMNGVSHQNAIIYRVGGLNRGGIPSHSSHNLDSSFRFLTGYIGHRDGSANGSANFRIYGDENLLFEHSQSSGELQTPINIFVEGINLLRIEVSPVYSGSPREFAFIGFLE